LSLLSDQKKDCPYCINAFNDDFSYFKTIGSINKGKVEKIIINAYINL